MCGAPLILWHTEIICGATLILWHTEIICGAAQIARKVRNSGVGFS